MIDYDGTLLLFPGPIFHQSDRDKVVELSENGSKVYLGDYDYYLEKAGRRRNRRMLAQDEPESAPAPTNKSDYYQSKEQQKHP